MDKNAIKKYAVWARRELISRVSQRAALYEITEKGYGDANAVSVLGRVMSADEKSQRGALIAQIREKGYEQVMEEIAYTWFNRFIALRFMEVNGYLPSHVRVFTDEENRFKPQILTEAINVELDGLDMEKVYALKTANDDDTLFKYLIIVQCNALSSILPGMFQRISDYTELLFPDNLLREGSVIEQMVSMIPEEDWTDQVQIIGWLYQYYNTEPKDKVFADLKKNIKISKENIPAATQLFTPDWIVRYMVENSLGRLWLEGHPNDALRAGWKYYLDEAEQEPDVQKQLAEIRKEYAALKPEEIKVIDPCCGSGHILAYMFDVLVQIYEAYGYSAREAVAGIVGNNLWGLDIDDRAAQLAYFSVMMKARQYDRRFFSRGIQPHVYAIVESNGLTTAPLHDMGLELTDDEYSVAVKQAWRLIEETRDAKEYGSIINITPCDWDLLRRFAIPRWESEGGQIPMEIHGEIEAAPRLQALTNVGKALAQKYHAVVTNPPYMGSSGMSAKLSEFVKKNYPNSKNDMSTVCMERCLSMCDEQGNVAMINIPVWMFLTSFSKMRKRIIKENTFLNMVHPGRGIFGSDFGTTTFVILKKRIKRYRGVYRRLFDKQGEVDNVEKRAQAFLNGKGMYIACQDDFASIPGEPIAYWLNNNLLKAFQIGQSIGTLSKARRGLETGDNEKFIRFWFEVGFDKIQLNALSIKDFHNTWIPHNKGGECRLWYGNRELVVMFENDGEAIRKTGVLNGYDVYCKEGITWTALTISRNSFRYTPSGCTFDSNKGPLIEGGRHLFYLLGLLNSVVCQEIIRVLNPSISLQNGDVDNIPVIINRESEVENLVKRCVELAKQDWDDFEISFDFQRHPLLERRVAETYTGVAQEPEMKLASSYDAWKTRCERRFNQLKTNEQELNRLFIEIYGLQEDLVPEVEDKDVTIRKADLQRDIRNFISYAVGCMFGRYSLDELGLAYAGGEWVASKYQTFIPDKDAILPICDDEYFEDDIVGRFVKFVETVYGKDTLEENLRFIADALGGKGSSREVIRNYFINNFYADHLKVYQKRPIYWLFDSGKKNGFKCLIYMHRYQPDTIARIRTDYVHEQQSRYRTAISDLESRIASAGTGERVKLSKQLTKLQDQAEELRVYEEKIHHLADQMIKIDLDDGVKVNYAKIQDVLAKIK